jgi:hypothetical protein
MPNQLLLHIVVCNGQAPFLHQSSSTDASLMSCYASHQMNDLSFRC